MVDTVIRVDRQIAVLTDLLKEARAELALCAKKDEREAMRERILVLEGLIRERASP